MTIREAIKKLQAMSKHYGDDIQVYFDCPQCKQSFTPSVVETAAIHLTTEDARVGDPRVVKETS